MWEEINVIYTDSVPAMPKHAPTINLLHKVNGSSSTDKVLTWALSVGRWIVIGTELVVICAFIGRFSLDIRQSDLKEDIETQKNHIRAFASVEQEFRGVQKRINSVGSALALQPDVRTIFSEFNKSFPQTTDLKINKFNWSKNIIVISGEAVDEKTISIFENNLRSSALIKNVNLTNVSLKVDGNVESTDTNLYEFDMTADIKMK